MRRVVMIALAVLAGCASSPSVQNESPQGHSSEWPALRAEPARAPDAPAWVETALSKQREQSLTATQATFFTGFYRETVSRVDGPTCRFRPTCSEFARQAVAAYGPLGFILSFGRLQRAHAHDVNRYVSEGRVVLDPVSAHGFWFDPSSEPRWSWHEHAESTR